MSKPTKRAVARYWAFDCHDRLNAYSHLIVDWGEAQCQACAYRPASHSQFDGSPTSWTKAKFLERAHIKAESLGGSDDPSNFLLLCKTCHAESPDVGNEDLILQWAVDRPHHFHHKYGASLSSLESAPTRNELDEAVEALGGVTSHFGIGLSPGTIAALLERVNESRTVGTMEDQ